MAPTPRFSSDKVTVVFVLGGPGGDFRGRFCLGRRAPEHLSARRAPQESEQRQQDRQQFADHLGPQ